MIYTLLFLLGSFVIIHCIFFVLFFFFKKETIRKTEDSPFVSILVAARNEEKNILQCIQAIENIDYPKDKFEVLIGNDASEDRTADIVSDFFEGKTNRRLINITKNIGKARAKANVLAQLAHEAKGEIFCITDADIAVPKTWLWALLTPFIQNRKIGTVTGFTVIKGKTTFHHLQAIDWIFALTLGKIFSNYKLPVTAMGNNMLISREAYFATGGYENFRFSIVEDYELFRQTLKKKFQFVQLLNVNVMAFSAPQPSFKALMQQRKRWMHGAVELAIFMRITLLAYALFYPLLLVLAFFAPYWALYLFMGKWLSKSFFLIFVLYRIKQSKLMMYTFIHEFYTTLLNTILPIYYMMPQKTVWKGRKY